MKNIRFPNIWLGYAIATLILLLIIVIPKTPKGSSGLLLLAFIMLLLLKVIYWCFCVYRIHKVIMGMTDNCYPITPGRAVGFGFIPIYNIYWMFKWPAEIIKFVNTRDKSRKLKPWVPGVLFLLGNIVAFRIYGPLWLFIDFAVLAYIINVLKKGFSADPVPGPYKERPKKMPVIVTIILGLLVTLPVIGLIAGAAVPFLSMARQAAEADYCVIQLKQIQAAKLAWASDTGAPRNAIPTWDDIVPKYIHEKLVCHSGTYTIGSVDSNPTCSVDNNNTTRTKDDHVLR